MEHMKRTGFVYDDFFLKHATPQWHPERKERLTAITAALKESGLWNNIILISPRRAELKDVEAVHTADYVRLVSKSGPGYLDPDTYLSEDTFEVSLFAAGAVMEAIDHCRAGKTDNVFCAVRPPGHHAEAHKAMGFCIFNNVAVGARYAQKAAFHRVFVADFDVHHGNGTEHIFYEDDSVFYFSTHQYPHYPGTGSERERGRGRGTGFTHNIPFPSGAGDREYETAYGETLHGLVKNFDPDIMLVSAGYDIHVDDPLSSIRVSDEGIRKIVRGILRAKVGIPCIFVLEGGYALQELGQSVVITVEEMMNA
jgi:acetoin utilization deacetylase AcuC-like enzyme